MAQFFFTPGPSQLHSAYESFMKDALKEHVGSISHRSKTFERIYERADGALRRIWNIPPEHMICFLGSATEAMERVSENTVERTSFHFVNGEFSKRFAEIAGQVGRTPLSETAEPGQGFELADILIPDAAEILCLTQNETSTGVSIAPDAIASLARRYPEKLVALDIVSSAPYPELDFGLLDCVFFSIQKGFGLPAGLGVLILSKRAIQRARDLQARKVNIGSYHSFPSLVEYGARKQTPETPNVLAIYLLARVAESFLEFGIANIRAETSRRAASLYDLLDNESPWKPFVKQAGNRSATVITIAAEEQTMEVQEKLAKEGLHVGLGYGPFKNRHIRVANFPALPGEAFDHLLRALRAM